MASGVGSLFAAGDAAVTAIPEGLLQSLSREPASPFARFTQDRGRILARWLVCRVAAVAIAAALFQEAADQVGLTRFGPLFPVIASVLTYGTLAELLSVLGRQRPQKLGALALRVLWPLEWAAAPLAEPLAWLGRIVARAVPKPRRDARTTESDLNWIVTQGERTGTLGNEPAQIIRRALQFKDLRAGEVMVPRPKISAVEIGTSLAKALEIASSDGHSRYPVYRASLDQIVGLLYAKDLFRAVREGKLETGKLADMVRSPVLFATETQAIASILREMQAKRQHLALVADEFGGTAGLITLEDILEELVGDIRDEYDTEGQFEDAGEGRVVADASVSVSDLARHLKRDLPNDGDFESLGGLIIHRSGRVPPVGTTVQLDGLKLIVREADQKRVVKVEVIVGKGGESKKAATTSQPDSNVPRA